MGSHSSAHPMIHIHRHVVHDRQAETKLSVSVKKPHHAIANKRSMQMLGVSSLCNTALFEISLTPDTQSEVCRERKSHLALVSQSASVQNSSARTDGLLTP